MTYLEKLNRIKARLGNTNAQLAVKLGVDRAQITRWLDGKPPSQDSLDKINKLYNQLFKEVMPCKN